MVLKDELASVLVPRLGHGRDSGRLALVEDFGDARLAYERSRRGDRGVDGEPLLAVEELHRAEVGQPVDCMGFLRVRKMGFEWWENEEGDRTIEASGDRKLRDYAERRERLEVLVALKDERELLLRRSDPKVVERNVPLGVGVLALRGFLRLRLDDEFRVLRVGPRFSKRRGRSTVSFVGKVLDDLFSSAGVSVKGEKEGERSHARWRSNRTSTRGSSPCRQRG